MYIFSILFVLISSPWVWELLHYNLLLLFILSLASILLFLSLIKTKNVKIFFILFCLTLLPILIIQFETTSNPNLGYMNPTEEQLFNIRRNEIDLLKISDNTGINLGKYLENKPEFMFYKFEQNLLRSIDLNSFFFGNHPREIPGIRNFEKFSFSFLPFFIFGLLKVLKSHLLYISISFLTSALELSIIGQNNPAGPFVLFPFFSAIIAVGIFYAIKKFKLYV